MQKKPKKLPTTHYQLLTSKGFTLIEVVLVLAITSIAFIAIYALYASNMKHNVESRYEIIASNLAQEGIEIIRNRRDEEILAGNDIDTFCNTTGVDCFPRYNGNPGVGACNTAGTIEDIGFNGSTYYNCNGACPANQATEFKRKCNVTDSDSDSDGTDDTLDVTCTVSWTSFVNTGISRSVSATSIMTDWHAN